MATVDDVVGVVAESRGGAVPANFRAACEAVEQATGGISRSSAEFEGARRAFHAHVGRDHDADFELWAVTLLHAIEDVRQHVDLSSTDRGELSDATVHTISLLREGEAVWVERLRRILQSGSWKSW